MNPKEMRVTGVVWMGYIGEYKKPPIYIIPEPEADGIFIDDILRKFLRKKVHITIKVVK